VSISAVQCRMIWWLVNWKLLGRKRWWKNWGTTSEFTSSDWGKSRKAPVRIADVPPQIPTPSPPQYNSKAVPTHQPVSFILVFIVPAVITHISVSSGLPTLRRNTLTPSSGSKSCEDAVGHNQDHNLNTHGRKNLKTSTKFLLLTPKIKLPVVCLDGFSRLQSDPDLRSSDSAPFRRQSAFPCFDTVLMGLTVFPGTTKGDTFAEVQHLHSTCTSNAFLLRQCLLPRATRQKHFKIQINMGTQMNPHKLRGQDFFLRNSVPNSAGTPNILRSRFSSVLHDIIRDDTRPLLLPSKSLPINYSPTILQFSDL
jgi:hypothetical protein